MHFLLYSRSLNEVFTKRRFLQLFDQHTTNPLDKCICIKENLLKIELFPIPNSKAMIACLCNQIEYLIGCAFTLFSLLLYLGLFPVMENI